MRGLAIFLLMLAVIASFSFITNSTASEKAEIGEKSKQFEFSTFTSAVCEDNEDSVHCRDEIFVNCDEKVSKADDISECNGIKIEIPKALGFAVFEKDWKDPRG